MPLFHHFKGESSETKMEFLENGAMNQTESENPSPSYKYTDLLPIVVSGLAPLLKVNLKSTSSESFLFFKTLVVVQTPRSLFSTFLVI